MKFKTLPLLAVLLFFGMLSNAQDSGENMFDNSYLHEIRFEFTQSNFWNILIANYENNADPMANKPYLMGKVIIDGEEVDSVGVRFKGFTSYPYGENKKPIKIDFNEFVPGKRYDGLRKLNLNNSTGDPSFHRDVVCYDMHRSIGVSAPRTSFTKVYFNDQYWGLYQTVEQVDQEFLQNNFSNDEGNLFKNLGWSKFEWLGSNANSYKEIFSLKTNRDLDDWSGFVNFINVLNNSSDAEFKEEIEQVFNVDLFLKALAVDVASNNWDSYLEHGRNWYIYEDTQTGIFHWIPWDYNFSFPGSGTGLGGGCEIFPDFTTVGNGTPTIQFYDFSWGSGIEEFSWNFGDGTFSDETNPEHTYSSPGTYDVCLTISKGTDCTETSCKTIETAQDLYQCESILDGSCPHPVGKNFSITLSFNPACCEIWGEDCEDIYQWFSNPGGIGGFDFAIDQRSNEGVLIRRLLNEPEYFDRYLSYYCDFLEGPFTKERYHNMMDQNKLLIDDAVQTDPHLLFTYNQFVEDIGPDGLQKFIGYRVDSLNLQLGSLTSCLPAPTIAAGDVVINELVASNDSSSLIVDAANEADDWIELYNNTSEVIDLSDAYLSDDLDNLLKWQFPPTTTIEGGGYLIIWADQQEDQPGLHCNFKLNKTSDQLILSNADLSNIDQTEFSDQSTNIAYARTPNGIGPFIAKSSTFGANNDNGWPVSTDDLSLDVSVNIFPVPAKEYLQVSIQKDTYNGEYIVDLFSITGQKLQRQVTTTANDVLLDLKGQSSGFYLLRIQDETGKSRSLKFIKAE